MAFQLLSNIPLVVLPPVAQASPAMNPAFQAVDPVNGNYFVASGRDLVLFYASPMALAAAWDPATVYLQGQVVNAPVGSPAVQSPFIAIATVAGSPPTNNVNQNPATSPLFWQPYTGSVLTVYSSPDQCTGRKSDIVNYPIPDGGHVQLEIEGSSYYTQVNGQVDFLASSNLVSVLIQSL